MTGWIERIQDLDGTKTHSMVFDDYDSLVRSVLAILPNSYFVELDGEIAILTGLSTVPTKDQQ